MAKKDIIPGSPQWESVCRQCGLCCLVKYGDKDGNVYLTNVACDNMDLKTGKCSCYSSKVAERGDNESGCLAHNGGKLDMESLKNDYLVPANCAYVQKFVGPNKFKPIDIRTLDLVHEKDVQESLKEHLMKGTWKLFKYNPHVNERIRDAFKDKKK